MPKYATFMTKILTAKDVCQVSQTVRNLRSQGRDLEARAILLRQTKPKHRAFIRIAANIGKA
ncbi:MAG TPA: hypothetical protein DG757_05705 [Bacillus sp. (in: Bacteria)]|nr:hypothetical protein [Bacillus sp. (in: firmicutes)]